MHMSLLRDGHQDNDDDEDGSKLAQNDRRHSWWYKPCAERIHLWHDDKMGHNARTGAYLQALAAQPPAQGYEHSESASL